jgi:monoamine oxidase
MRRDGDRATIPPNMKNTKSVDVLVVGGGFTGLAAARALAAEGVDFLLVDSFSDHLGGRAYSYDDGELRFDHGAQYVGDLQNAVMKEVRALLEPGELVNGAALRRPYPWEVMVLDQRRMPFKSSDSLFGIPGCPPQLGLLGALQMVGLLAEMTLIECCIDTVQPWEGPAELLALDQVTVWDWVTSKKWVDPAVADLVRISVEALLSVEPTEISVYYFLWYCACNDGFLTEINDDTGGPQQYWLLRGTRELAVRYAEPVRDRIRQGVSVRAITIVDDGVEVDLEGERIAARRVIVATSPATAGRRIAFTPGLPPARRALLSQPMGTTLKCQIYYRSDWWHHAAGGKAYDGYVGGAHYPVLWVMDNSPPDAQTKGGPFVLMTFTVGDMLTALGSHPSQEDIERYVTGTLNDLFQDERALSTSSEFVRLVAYTWDREEPEVGGGPNTVFTPGMLTGEAGRLLNEPWEDRVFFASAESCLNPAPRSASGAWSLFAPENLPQYDDEATLLPKPAPPFFSKYSDRRKGLGYMDGALASGVYAAQQVLASLGHEDRRPKAPPLAAIAPPAPAPHDVDSTHAVLTALAERLEGATVEALADLAKTAAAEGRLGHASWLRDALVAALRDQGVRCDEPLATLAAVRDFVASLVQAHRGVEGAAAAGAQARIREAVDAAERRVAALFSR